MDTRLAPLSTTQLTPGRFDVGILAGQVRPSTVAMYRRDFAEYLTFATSFDMALQPSTLARWRTELADMQSKSPNTINRMLSAVRALMKAAAEQGYISHELAQAFENVRGVKVAAMRDRLKPDARTRITADNMRRLCEAPDTDTLAGKMHHALLLTLATSGLRISELVSLTIGQIEERTKGKTRGYTILVTGKGDTVAREAPLSIEAYTAIQTWLVARPVASGWIFTGFGGRGSRDPHTNHIHPVSAWELVKRYAATVGLEGIKPHDFRRFVGTQLAKSNPRQAQKALGHKSIDTTYKHYVLDELEVGLTDNLF